MLRIAHRIWKETKQEPGTAGPGNMLGSCLISFHFLWAILSTSTVYFLCRGKFLQLRKGDKFLLKRSVVTTRLAFCLIGAVKSSKQLQQRALRIREGRKLLMNIDYRRRGRRCCAKSDRPGASFCTNFQLIAQSLSFSLRALNLASEIVFIFGAYRGENKGLYVVARNFFLLLLNCSAWPCLGPA